MLYLSSPYSGSDEVQEERYNATALATVRMIDMGAIVFSPIVHSHHLHKVLPLHYDKWIQYDLKVLRSCTRFGILMLNGWEFSNGVALEAYWAKKLGLSCCMIRSTDLHQFSWRKMPERLHASVMLRKEKWLKEGLIWL